MKKVKKVVKCDSNMVCYTRSQRVRGYIAFTGLLACGFMIGWGFGSEPAKKISSGNDDVLILSSDKIDLTDAKIGTEKGGGIKITAKRPVRITDVRLGQNIDDLYVSSTCMTLGDINLGLGCTLEVFYRPQVEMPMVESRNIFINWVDGNGNTGEAVVGLDYSSVFDYDLDCIQKEELLLEELPSQDADNYYEARVKAYAILCGYCQGPRASAYCQRKLEEARTNFGMLSTFKAQLENKQ